ncbi:MAG TPA: DinB family protein [Acidimicrobiales bacterium]|jgi:uncharacterized damage-inducible protein DinB|nr:DinB family protein [Acidimicrobiales bacterium]
MQLPDVLTELFDRIPPLVREVAGGLDADQLRWRPTPESNSIGWLLWHLIRVQDHHVSELVDEPQIWTTGDWSSRFGLEPDPRNTGYGHSGADVATVRPDGPDALTSYCDAVCARTRNFLRGLQEADLDRVVDKRWDPPVTMGVRLVSVAEDDLQHAGQAAYAKGLLNRD